MTVRDTQKSKVYAADNAARKLLPRPFITIKGVERYLAKQSQRVTLRTRYGTAVDLKRWPVEVGDGRGTRNAYAHGSYKITLPLWARDEWVLLHEFAHIIHSRLKRHRNGSRAAELAGGASHGWQYAAIYLDLVRFIMGAEAAAVLKAQFKTHKVRFRAKRVVASRQGITPTFGRKPVVTDEMARAAVEGNYEQG